MGNITIFRNLCDCKDLWEEDQKRVSFAFPLPANLWRSFYNRKPAFTKLLLGDFHLISEQDVQKKVGCRWELIQFVKHREEDSRRVEVGKIILRKIELAAVRSAVKVKVSACTIVFTLENKSAIPMIQQILSTVRCALFVQCNQC